MGRWKRSTFWGNVMIWIKIVRLAVSSYHSAGVLYDLFKELSFSAPVMPPWLSGGQAPLLSPCNLSWVLPFTQHYSQLLAQMPMYLQTSRLRLQNNENVAAQVLLYALCEAGRASAVCCCWPEHHTLTALHGFSTGAATGLKQIRSQLTIFTTLTTTTTLMSDQALKPAVESCCVLCSKLFFTHNDECSKQISSDQTQAVLFLWKLLVWGTAVARKIQFSSVLFI